MTSREILDSVRRRQRAIEEVADDALALIDAAEAYGAIAWRWDDRVREVARAADARLRAGGAVRPLEGIPVTVKELLPVEGQPWDQGSAVFQGLRAPATATLALRLEAAGAIIIAGTSAAELGALPTTENARGACVNPHDPKRTAGGSSGGAAVCASLGIAMNHGSDGGGSIRIPAACCGVVGLKPSLGRVTAGPLSGDGWGGLSVNGSLTPTVEDAAMFLAAVSGPTPSDPPRVPLPRRPFPEAVGDRTSRRIAVAFSRGGLDISSEAREATSRAADALADAGHEVTQDSPDLDPLEEGFGIVSTIGIGATLVPPERIGDLLPRTRQIWQDARSVQATELMRALESLAVHGREVMAFFERYDALLTPTLEGPAPILGTLGRDAANAWEDYKVFLQWTWPCNATGQPAISVPFGHSDRLPLGVQLAGRKGDEWSLIALAAELERRS